MLLRYYGINVNPDMVISRLKKGDVPHYENNVMYGGNPLIEFVGDPYSKYSYGVYERPIMDVANSFKSGIKGGVIFLLMMWLIWFGMVLQLWHGLL